MVCAFIVTVSPAASPSVESPVIEASPVTVKVLPSKVKLDSPCTVVEFTDVITLSSPLLLYAEESNVGLTLIIFPPGYVPISFSYYLKLNFQ